MEMDNRPPPTTVYKHQAKAYLCDLFPCISCRAIGIVFEHHAFNFTNAFRVLTQIRGTEDRNEIGTVFAFERGVKVFILKDRVKKNTEIRDPVLLADLAQIDELANAKENNRPAKNDDEDDDKKIEPDKTLLECGCCFGEYGPDNMVHCSADIDHLVCQECLYNHVSEQVDGKNSSDTPCIILHNCAGQYQIAQLDKFLSPKLKGRFHERKFLAVLSDAGMEDVWTCQECNYKGFLGDPIQNTVYCPQCAKVYCTQCHKVQHKNKTCKEVEQERSDVYRLAEDAMTKATVRMCPNQKCQKQFQKLDGCNKMKCSCGTLSCYLCGMNITAVGYNHFCNTHGCSCGMCHLWGKFEEQDRKARHAAGRKVFEDAGVAEKDIDRFLLSPPAKKSVPRAVVQPPQAQRRRQPAADRQIPQRAAAPPQAQRPHPPAAAPQAQRPRHQPVQEQEPPAQNIQDPAPLEAPHVNPLQAFMAFFAGLFGFFAGLFGGQ